MQQVHVPVVTFVSIIIYHETINVAQDSIYYNKYYTVQLWHFGEVDMGFCEAKIMW